MAIRDSSQNIIRVGDKQLFPTLMGSVSMTDDFLHPYKIYDSNAKSGAHFTNIKDLSLGYEQLITPVDYCKT